MQALLKNIAIILLLICSVSVCVADEQRDQLLELHSYILWQRINEVRRNPVQYLAEHGISREQAENDMGISAEVLDAGLPPLAWSAQLHISAAAHGQDMVERLYYSKDSLEGEDPLMRAQAAGYQATAAGESLGIIAFSNYVEISEAVEYVLENLLRDELDPTNHSDNNIFSVDYTEVGFAFLAENLDLVPGLNYVYLAVLDFAQPLDACGFVVASAVENSEVSLYSFADASVVRLSPLSPLLPSVYQLPFPSGGGMIISRQSDQTLQAWRFVADQSSLVNSFIDLN
ncbi:MAG: CAP domain-containing protein [Desulfuromonas sp.]|nr:CAP domain-containing protein [Desulfuromonas sp.]